MYNNSPGHIVTGEINIPPMGECTIDKPKSDVFKSVKELTAAGYDAYWFMDCGTLRVRIDGKKQ
jgi:hypothetical protein